MEQNTVAPVSPVREKPTFSTAESVFALIMLFVGFLFARYVVWNEPGIITTAVFLVLIAACVVFLKLAGKKFSAGNIALFTVMTALSFVFSITDNRIIKLLTILVLIALGVYSVFAVGYSREKIGMFFPSDCGSATFRMPFSSFGKAPAALNSKARPNGFSASFKWVLIGLLVAIPITVVVLVLLMSADGSVEELFVRILNNIGDEVFPIILQAGIAVPVAFYLFGMLYSAGNGVKANKVSEEANIARYGKGRVLPNLLLYSAVTPALILYVVFFVYQIQYLLSAFRGLLPKGFSYAEYARRGFFELFALALINLVIILVITRFAKSSGEKKSLAFRIYVVIICLFTLFLIATAMSKMAMYMARFGLTFNRVFASWIMVVLTVLFLLIIVKQFCERLPLARIAVTASIILFMLLAFCNVDARIAQYNIASYEKGTHTSLDGNYLLELSDDALVYIIRNDKLALVRANSDEWVWDDYYDSTLNQLKHGEITMLETLNASTLYLKEYVNGR